MQVYRVEKDGVGPYNHPNTLARKCSWELLNMVDRHCAGGNGHPSVANVGEPWECFGMPWDHICGFASLDQLNRWFSEEERKILAREGFRIMQIEVMDERVRMGKSQITISRKAVKHKIDVTTSVVGEITADRSPIHLRLWLFFRSMLKYIEWSLSV